MAEEKKDFKEVKVKVTGGSRDEATLSQTMLYSGVNIFGALTKIYMQAKEDSKNGNFAGFGESSGSGKNRVAEGGLSGASGSVMMQMGQQNLQIFKKLQKRDPITKIKAFGELARHVRGMNLSKDQDASSSASYGNAAARWQQSCQEDDEEFPNLLTFFLYHFCSIIGNEEDKQVRLAAHDCLGAFIEKNRRAMGSHLKKAFPLWFCSFFDPSPEVARTARINFNNCFPKNQQGNVFKIVYKNFITFCSEHLMTNSSDSANQEESKESKKKGETSAVDRISSEAFQALANSFEFIQSWSAEDQESYKSWILEELDLDQGPVAQKAGKKGGKPKTHPIFSYLSDTSKGKGQIRGACLQFIAAFIANMPRNITDLWISQIAQIVFLSVGENQNNLQTILWRDALFAMGQSFPQSWIHINIKKDFLPKLYKCLKEAGYGSAQALYQNFVKFLSISPAYHLTGYDENDKSNKISFKERCNLVREVFSNLYAGLANDESVTFHKDLVNSYAESLTFFLLKRLVPLFEAQNKNLEDESMIFALSQIDKVIQQPIYDYIQTYEKFQSKVQNERNPKSTVPERFAEMLINLSERSLPLELFTKVCQSYYSAIEQGKNQKNQLKIFACVVKSLKLKADSNKKVQTIGKEYKKIIFEEILGKLVAQVGTQVSQLSLSLSKQNIDDCLFAVSKYSELVYILAKRSATKEILMYSDISQEPLKLGSLYKSVTDKMNKVRKMLSADLIDQFNQTRKFLLNSAIFYLALGYQPKEVDFDQIIEATGLMNPPDENTKFDILEQYIFIPPFPKLDLNQYYYKTLRNDQDLHEQLLTSLSIKMLSEQVICQYKNVIKTVVQESTDGNDETGFLLNEDIDMIRVHVSELLVDDDMQPEIFVAYFEAVEALCIHDDEQNDELREIMLSKLMTMRITDPKSESQFNSIWTIFSKTIQSGNQFYKDFSLQQIESGLSDLIDNYKNSPLNTTSLESFTYFAQLVSKYVNLHEVASTSEAKVKLITRILLSEENFDNLTHNCMPLTLLKNLLLEGTGCDIQALLSEKSEDNQYKYVWLAALFLNIKHLESLNSFMELKRQLMLYVETEVMPALVLLGQDQDNHAQFLVQVFTKIGSDKESVHTVRYLAQRMVDPGEEYPSDCKPILKTDHFYQIYKNLGEDTAKALLESNFAKADQNEFKNDLLVILLQETGYYLIDQPTVKDLFKSCQSHVQSADQDALESGNSKIQIQVYLALEQWLVTDSNKDDQVSVQTAILNKMLKIQDDNQSKLIAVQLCCHLLDRNSVSLVKVMIDADDLHMLILDLLTAPQEEVPCETIMQVCRITRKSLNWTTPASAATLASLLVQQAADRALHFETTLVQFAAGQSNSQLKNFEVEMLQELAETILVCCPLGLTETDMTCKTEDNLYALLDCPAVVGLQKAAYVVLKFVYENMFIQLQYALEDDETALKRMAIEAKESRPQANENSDEEEAKASVTKEDEAKYNFRSIAFKNISQNLIRLIENAPSSIYRNEEDEEKDQQMFDQIGGQSVLESLVQGKKEDGCIDGKTFGYLLAWNAMLLKIQHGRIKATLGVEQGQGDNSLSKQYLQVLSSLTEFLETDEGIYKQLLFAVVPFLPSKIRKNGVNANFAPEQADLSEADAAMQLSLLSLTNFMKSFPSLGRKFYQDCDKRVLNVTLPYIRSVVSPAILEDEIRKIEVSQLELGGASESELSFELYKSTKEVVATYKKGDLQCSLKLRIPHEYPLKSVEVDIGAQLKLNVAKMRKWTLSIRNLLQTRNGDIISAILLWRNNIEKEVAGVEECYICYSVQHQSDKSLPSMQCKNCKNKFHAACIRKWFNTSNKSNCPLCQTFFFH